MFRGAQNHSVALSSIDTAGVVGDIADELVRGKGFSGDSGLVDVTVRGAFVSLVVVVFIIAVVLLAALLLGPLLFFENRLRLGRLPKKGVERAGEWGEVLYGSAGDEGGAELPSIAHVAVMTRSFSSVLAVGPMAGKT